MEKQYITVNGEQKEMPESRLLKDVVALYGVGIENDLYMAKVNGKIIHSVIDGTDTVIDPGDKIELFALVVGG
ncbi:MAG: MoaD/ThiS family protein [Firmicutes bacterium]|nr:MoaD/ThiS family protein [Bacillota bacterium]